MGRSRYKTVNLHKTYFASSAVVNWLPVFAVPTLAEVVLESLRFLHHSQRITLHAYVLMEDHFHLVASASDFSKEMKALKSFTATNIVKALEASGPSFFLKQFKFFKKRHKTDQVHQVWQEGFHPKAIIDEMTLAQKIEYTHYNPVRRGYVDKPEHWRYSSCRDYLGQTGLVPVSPLI